MFEFPFDRLRAELEWIARNEIEFVYLGDSNFGMLQRDLAVADLFVETKARFGYPKRIFGNTAKNATRRIFDLSQKLSAAGLSKGATLSMQSWNKETLVAIKRGNIKGKTYEDLQGLFKENGVPTYSELILGLPGETLSSFCDGIDKNLDAGQHDGLLVYLCRVLPGSEMDAEDYRKKYGLQTVSMPIMANHGSLDGRGVGPTEYEETVVATSTMTREDWLEAQRIAWFVSAFFVLGMARYPLLWLRDKGVKATEFARLALAAAENTAFPLLQRELRRVNGYLSSLAAGVPEVPREGIEWSLRINWPVEEASFLALSADRDAWFEELRLLMRLWLHPATSEDFAAVEETIVAAKRDLRHWTTDVEYPDRNDFSRERIWYARRGGSLLEEK